jgi:hypothetical protein
MLVQHESDAFFVTPSSSCSSRRHHYQHRFVHPPNKGSPSFGRFESSYKRVKVDPPKDLRAMKPDDVAKSLETILKEQRDMRVNKPSSGRWMHGRSLPIKPKR